LHLYSGQKGRLVMALFFYIIKHSPVWLMPLITASIIDIVSRGGPPSGAPPGLRPVVRR
jgi:ATP-binding cassette subfamily B protein